MNTSIENIVCVHRVVHSQKKPRLNFWENFTLREGERLYLIDIDLIGIGIRQEKVLLSHP